MRRSGLQSRRFNLIPVSIFLFLIIFSIPTVAFSQRVKELQQLTQQRIENGVSQQRRSEIIEQIVDYYCNNSLDGVSDVAGTNAEAGGAAGFSDANVEGIMEHFEKLLRSPLNINNASRSDLQRLIILTDFQITALLEYIKYHGAVISYPELSLLNGYNEEIVNLLRPFIYFGEAGLQPGNFFKDCSTTIYSKYSRKFQLMGNATDSKNSFGTPDYIQLRYRTVWLNKVETAFLIEKDAGEPMVEKNRVPCGDFISFSIALRNLHFANRNKKSRTNNFKNDIAELRTFTIDNIIIGDFSAKYGQGLTLWNSFNLQGAEDIYGFYKRGEVVSPYTSSDENNFFRGAAAQVSCGRFTLSLLGSYKGIDAKLSPDGKSYTSLISGGVHDSESLMQTKSAMHEAVAGAYLTVLFNKIRLGVSFAGYGYDKINGRSVKDYNRYQIYDNLHWNCAADFYTVIGGMRIFGEAAYSSPGRETLPGYAVVAGGSAQLGGGWKMNFLARSYSRSYINPHAGGYTSTSSCSNQSGCAFRISGGIFRGLKMSAGADYVYYPWARFNINSSSSSFKTYVKIEYSKGAFNISERLSYNCLRTTKFSNMLSWKTIIKLRIAKWLNIGAKGECNRVKSRAITLQSNVKFSHLTLNVSGTYYCVKEWNGRLYMVEYDLPMTYASTLLYGRGFNFYATAQLRVGKWLELFAKCGENYKRGDNGKAGEKKSLLNLKAGIRFNL